MSISVAGIVRRVPAGAFREPLDRVAGSLDSVLSGIDDRSVSQRVALIAFATRIVGAVIAYVLQVLLARWMGGFQYGVFVSVWVGAVILGGLSCLGFQKAIIRFVPEYSALGETALLRGVLRASRLQGIVTSTVIALVGAGAVFVFRDLISTPYLMPLFLAAICLPMMALTEIQEGVARGFNWADMALWPTYIYRPLLIVLFMWVAVEFGRPADASTAMLAVIGATYVAGLIQSLTIKSRLKSAIGPGPSQFALLPWVGITLPIFLVEGFYNLLTNVDILIVGRLRPAEEVAVYFAVVKTLALIHFVYYAVRASAAQRFSQYWAVGDRVRLKESVRDALHWTFWPSLGMAVILIVIGRPMLALFGPSFTAGYPLVFIFIIGLMCRASVGPAESLLMMSGQQRICAVIYSATFVLNVALNFLLIGRYGIAGAAVATSLALIAEAVSLYVITWSRLGIRCAIFFAGAPTGTVAEAG